MTKINPICGLCKKIKNPDEFYSDRKKINGLTTYCKECIKEKSKGSYARNPERCKEAMKKWRKNNPEKDAFIKAKHTFGITREQYDSLKRVCTICGDITKLCIDHSHQSGRIRGMLCSSCNKGLGFFKDNPTLLLRASDYILGNASNDIFEATYEKVVEE